MPYVEKYFALNFIMVLFLKCIDSDIRTFKETRRIGYGMCSISPIHTKKGRIQKKLLSLIIY